MNIVHAYRLGYAPGQLAMAEELPSQMPSLNNLLLKATGGKPPSSPES
jgi:hypothetical protein